MDTLGSLVDKLSIIELKIHHSDDAVKRESLAGQRERLLAEIDEFVSTAIANPNMTLTNPANKVYATGADFAQEHASTLAGLVSELVTANIRMWHIQEIMYDRKALEAYSKEEMLDLLIRQARQNTERNYAIDALDAHFAGLLND